MLGFKGRTAGPLQSLTWASLLRGLSALLKVVPYTDPEYYAILISTRFNQVKKEMGKDK